MNLFFFSSFWCFKKISKWSLFCFGPPTTTTTTTTLWIKEPQQVYIRLIPHKVFYIKYCTCRAFARIPVRTSTRLTSPQLSSTVHIDRPTCGYSFCVISISKLKLQLCWRWRFFSSTWSLVGPRHLLHYCPIVSISASELQMSFKIRPIERELKSIAI